MKHGEEDRWTEISESGGERESGMKLGRRRGRAQPAARKGEGRREGRSELNRSRDL